MGNKVETEIAHFREALPVNLQCSAWLPVLLLLS